MYKKFALLLVALSIIGCSKDKSTTGEPAMEAMGMYAQGFNEALKVHDDLTDYFERVPGEGPTKGEKYNIFPSHRGAETSLKTISTSFVQAKDAAPSTLAKLAPLSDEVLSTLKALNKTYGEVHSYYDAEDYKDDDYAKGVAMHKTISSDAEAASKAIAALGDALSGIEDEQSAAELKKYAASKKHSYWFRYFNVEAKKGIKAVEAGDVAALTAALAAVETAQKGLTDFGATMGDSPAAGAFNAYIGAADRFTNSLKKLNREVSGEDEQKIVQLTDQTISAYNSLISVTNSLYDLEGSGVLK